MKTLISLLAAAVCAVGLADSYVPVEFIVSTGSQYADTGVRLNPALSRIDARFVLMSAAPSTSGSGAPCIIAGAFYCSPHPTGTMDEATDVTYNNRSHCLSYDKSYVYPNFVRSNNQDVYRVALGSTITDHTAWWVHQAGPAHCFVNTQGSKKGWDSNNGCGYYDKDKVNCWIGTCYLGTANKTAAFDSGAGAVTGEPYNAEGDRARVKWYGFRIATNDVLQADLIPARRVSDSAYGFYDRVRGTFHPSKSSTPFAGPTICPWTPSAAADPMDASHFAGTVPSGKLDVISVPAATTIGFPSAAAVASVNGLGGIRLEAATTVCMISNVTAGTTLRVPFYGTGTVFFRDSTGYLNVRGDSSEFRGTFSITNACITVGWPLSFGVTNCVHIYEGYNNVGSRRVDFTSGAAVYRNEFHFDAAYNSSQNSVIYSTTSGSEFAGPNYFACKSQVWFQHGDVTYTWSGPIYPEGETANTVKCNSRPDRTIFNGADKWLGLNTFYLTQSTPIDCHFHATHKAFDQTKQAPCNILLGNGKRLGLQRANVFDEDFAISFDAGNPASSGIDMNGHDQRIGRLNLRVADVNKYAGELYPNFTITTPDEQPATLTIREGWFLGYGKAIQNYPGLFPGRLVGPVSLVLDVKDDYGPSAIRFVTTNDTTGAMVARRGTIAFGASARFENLTSLEATDEGQIVVETSEIATARADGLDIVALTNRAAGAGVPLTIGADCTVVTHTAIVGRDRWLAAGTYTRANCPKYVAGDGELVVREYGGKKGLIILFK